MIAGKRVDTRWIFVGGVMLLLLFYFLFDPLQSRWMPQCVFHKVTGLQCMGCGAQRMIHSLLHGEIREAFQANAFLFLMMPFLGFMLWLELSRKKFPRLYSRVHSQASIITISAMLVAWLIVRNIYDI